MQRQRKHLQPCTHRVPEASRLGFLFKADDNVSALLWPGPTSRTRTSAVTAPCLPAAGQHRIASLADTRPPGSRATSVRTGPGLRPRRVVRALALARSAVLPSTSRTASAPGMQLLSRFNSLPRRRPEAGLCAPRPPLRRHPRGCQRTAWGRGGFATPSSWWIHTTYSLPVSRRTQIKSELLHHKLPRLSPPTPQNAKLVHEDEGEVAKQITTARSNSRSSIRSLTQGGQGRPGRRAPSPRQARPSPDRGDRRGF